MTKIKICGLSRIKDAEYVNEALPDYIGFVFAESRRNVTRKQAQQIKQLLDSSIKSVGVFVDADIDEVISIVQDGIIDLVQLHGDEDTAYIEKLREMISAPIIKAIRVQSAQQILQSQNLPCDYVLLDTYQKSGYGGSGKAFDWKLIPPIDKPYFLAGGIGLGNIREALKLRPYCIDVSSGAETDGVKDRAKIAELVKIVRSDNT